MLACGMLACGLALAGIAGCGGGGGDSSSPAADPKIRDAAAAKIQDAASKVVDETRDRNIPGPKYYKVVCIEPGNKLAKGVPENQVKCHIEAFFATYKGKAGGYIGSEDWLVPVQNGKVGQPTIAGEYRIKAYLVADDTKNCTGRHLPDKCTPPPPPPTD